MKRNRDFWLRPLFFFYAGVPLLGKGEGPTSKAVRRELQRILSSDPLFKQERQFDWSRLDWEWINTLADLIRYPLLILLLFGIGLGCYFLLLNLAPYLRGAAGEGVFNVNNAARRGREPEQNTLNTYYRQALAHAAAGQYREALVALHRATVDYLLTHIIVATPGKTYTNNDLKRRLADHQSLYQPFAFITTYAEIAEFSTNEIKPADFSQALLLFENHFLDNRRGSR